MNNPFVGYEIPISPLDENGKKHAPHHQLAEHCDRLCRKLGIPFCTIILRYLKKDEQLTESVISYMAEKGIRNVRYLTVAFNNQIRLRK